MRVALVTGAARGIGAATVAALVELDYRVIAVDGGVDDPDLPYAMGTPDQLAALAGPNVLTAQADVRDLAALAAAVELAEVRRLGRIYANPVRSNSAGCCD